MQNSLDLAEIGALLGDPARATMLEALIDGRALTAKELAFRARVTPQTASLHLRKLSDANLLSVLAQGRHRYFRLASPLVAQMIEAVGAVAAVHAPPRYRPTGPRDAQIREARICYDHLAGRLGVALADALVARGAVALDAEGGEITQAGAKFFAERGIDLGRARASRRAFCRPCLDWSERRFHIGGAVGAALARHALDRGWVTRLRDTRAVAITAIGWAGLRELGIEPEPSAAAA
jgi:DNA-binding transcriptional ArsR family regulator